MMQNSVHSRNEKKLFGETQQDVVGGPSIVFTRKAIVDELFSESLQTYANELLG